MQLTPLHFPQTIVGVNQRRASYGGSYYVTDCRRFIIHQRSYDDWRVNSAMTNDHGWFDWLHVVGISDTAFATRRAAVEALDVALTADGLMNAQSITR